MTADLSAFVLELATDTKSFVAQAMADYVATIEARCKSLEQEVLELKSTPDWRMHGPPGESIVGPQGERGERGEKGLDGINGKDADLALLFTMQASLSSMQGEWAAFKAWQAGALAEAVAKIQPVTLDPVMLEGMVQKHLETQRSTVDEDALVVRVKSAVLQEIPTPRDGKDGKDGKDGVDGAPGRDGRDGIAGPAGEKGADGLNGKDGLGFDEIDLTFSEDTGHVLKMASGDRVKEWPLYAPFDVGTWKPGVIYPKGAMVTDHGALYTARMATSARPGQPNAESRAWRLAVKSGKDGKNGKDGKDGI